MSTGTPVTASSNVMVATRAMIVVKRMADRRRLRVPRFRIGGWGDVMRFDHPDFAHVYGKCGGQWLSLFAPSRRNSFPATTN